MVQNDGDRSRTTVAPSVDDALRRGRPVVALESTVFAHGLPHPAGVETALAMEEDVRRAGAVPATIGLVDGRLCVGLSPEQIERLATEPGVAKVGRRDLGVVAATGRCGATTVGGTLAAMALVGLRVMATGGIGGVHRGAAQTFDVSGDLTELGRVPAVVVCAGAKAVLDLPKTLEALETLGVPVVGFETDEFPAFYSRASGLPVLARADTPQQVARMAATHWALGSTSSLLLAAPVPPEVEIPRDVVEAAVTTALHVAEQQGLRGPAVTPFLLEEVRRATGDRSLRANIALLRNNARLAARIAAALSATTAAPAPRRARRSANKSPADREA